MLEAFATLLEFLIPGVTFLSALAVLFWTWKADSDRKRIKRFLIFKRTFNDNPARAPIAVAFLCISVGLGAVIDLGMYRITDAWHDCIVKAVYNDCYALNVNLPANDDFFNPKDFNPKSRSDQKLNREWYSKAHHRLAGVSPWMTTSASRLQAGIHLCLNLVPSLIVILIASIFELYRDMRSCTGITGAIGSVVLVVCAFGAWAVAERAYHESIFVNAQIQLHYDLKGMRTHGH